MKFLGAHLKSGERTRKNWSTLADAARIESHHYRFTPLEHSTATEIFFFFFFFFFLFRTARVRRTVRAVVRCMSVMKVRCMPMQVRCMPMQIRCMPMRARMTDAAL